MSCFPSIPWVKACTALVGAVTVNQAAPLAQTNLIPLLPLLCDLRQVSCPLGATDSSLFSGAPRDQGIVKVIV